MQFVKAGAARQTPSPANSIELRVDNKSISFDKYLFSKEIGLDAVILQNIRKLYAPLSLEEEFELGRRSQNGDIEARNKLVNHNMRFVLQLACKYASKYPHIDYDDLVSEGAIGLLKAAKKYDPSTGLRLLPYAKKAVTRQIQTFIYENSSAVRFPYAVSEQVPKIRGAMSDVNQDDAKAISEKTGIDLKYVKRILPFLSPTASLDSSVHKNEKKTEDNDELVNFIKSDDVDFEKNFEIERIRTAIEALPPRCRDAVIMRYGIYGEEKTYKEIAAKLNVSSTMAKKYLNKSLQILRSNLR